MSEQLEKQLISVFTTAWGEVAPALLGRPSTLATLSSREVTGEGLESAVAGAAEWPSAFVADCIGALSGSVVCLFKHEDREQIESMLQSVAPGGAATNKLALINAALSAAAMRFSATSSQRTTFGEATFLDLSADQSRLAALIGESVWLHTFSLTVGDEMDTQALLFYAPADSYEDLSASNFEAAAAPAAPFTPPSDDRPSASFAARREPAAPRNIERLLDVELEVVVRFGVTNMPLRDVVRMGPGTMIELDRGVDEPVELLVNGQPLARGEVVVVDGYYGVRITEISARAERALSFM